MHPNSSNSTFPNSSLSTYLNRNFMYHHSSSSMYHPNSSSMYRRRSNITYLIRSTSTCLNSTTYHKNTLRSKSRVCNPSKNLAYTKSYRKKTAVNGSAPAAKEETTNKCISSSLQEDLEVSDSDDEVVEIKNTSTDSAKSPANKTSDSSANLSATSSNMDVPLPAAASNSSSSESCDSDSDDSSSESNDSDSSASSEHSDADTPSKMWGLSNFFDETRRNHSPAFLPLDTSTNSSTAVKEEPILAPVDERESFTLDDNSMNGILRGPVADPITGFLELDTPVIRNEILSPIPSPMHPVAPSAPPVRGPRTPPSPSYPVKEDVTETSENQNPTESKKEESSISVELSPFVSPLPPPPLQSSQPSKHFDAQENRSDSVDEKCKPQNEKSKNQIRTSKPKLDSCSSKVSSSHMVHSFDQNESEPSASKELQDASKDEVKNDAVMTVSSSVPSEKSDSAHENYTIKTRQKHSTPNVNTKKNKSVISDNSENGQKVSISSVKTSTNKPKHPTRSCRVPGETKQNTKSTPPVSSAKQEPKEEPKRRSKPDVKTKQDVENSSKIKETAKSANLVETAAKNTSKVKKAPKSSPKQPVELKKSEIKRKKKKFAIENFLQSTSPEKSPIYDAKKDSLDIRSPPEFQGLSSKSPSRPAEGSEKGKEKLRRSVRCSERASNTSQSESSGQNSGNKKRNSKKPTKSKSTIENLPIHLEPPPQLLSPIPQDSLFPTITSECAIPFKIMVCIPLDKITRLPLAAQVSNVENKQVSKPRTSVPQNVDEDSKSQSKDMLEKATKSVNKRTQPKDFKDKPRTALPSKNNKNNKIVSSKTEKSSKSSDSMPLPKVKPTSSVNVKSSIKSSSDNVLCDNVDKLPKKRKTEEKEKQLSKKPKVSSRTLEEKRTKEHASTLKNDLAANQTENSAKSKALERCDSASSLSSLCSQQSQRSSKSAKGKIKDSSANASDGKRVKTFTPLLSSKEIKQEKEDKPKVHIKKESELLLLGKINRSIEIKISIKDTEPKEKCELFWNDSLNSSSQYCHWEEAEDSKGQITSQSLIDRINRDIKLDWDHFSSEMHKELKEATNLTKHNSQTPIMPMDYYWTEGQKQRQLADKEKDPLVQVLKYFEATVLFILTSQQREEYSKDPDSVYQFYMETLKFSAIITQSVRKLQSCPGSSEFKLLILCLKCQSLLYVKLYNLKIKEIKEKLKGVTDFFHHHCPNITVNSFRNSSHPSPHQSRLTNLTSVPSPHSPTPSPASSVTSQTSGYSSSDINGNHARSNHLSQLVNVPQSMLDMICRQHNHLYNLHLGHDLWEQADMYMTRSNLREFFKEVADQSEPLTLHSSIKELVNYIQKGLSLVKKYPR
ncbi:LOW QUALITY PROTEIN: dentin sialophosphoprotein-like [Uloborus diversus]|uniref:LOW QUALITY PROTEIN: dentin sialophosphoprotein-like n=1 Tax=Uloborus diversus TaxID=327109 RepID=UPI002409EB7E|nr:LOW QUALITY PROTEIN: dentin sialophosphoprotein-like [Uloborus diversus]